MLQTKTHENIQNTRLDDNLLAGFMRAAWKEINKASRQNVKEILESSLAHKEAIMYKEATSQFLSSRGVTCFATSTEDITEALMRATQDNELRQDKQHLLEITGSFQRQIMDLLNLYIVLAQKSLLARDGHGRYLVSAYGGSDQESLEYLKEMLKKRKGYDKEERKRYVEMLELLLGGK